ncbi:DNA polymerase III subunit alpha [Neptuniibacter sp. QD37_11]|uniref:DNA polymerase III subunit alpha n=1 Tax=Neptuniibacter sp. QD37_11 TaxID=3398209 RepID=UPI0039F501D1
MASFVHLDVHTEYSMGDSIVRLKPLLKKADECGVPAVAVSDPTNFFNSVKLYKQAQASGLKPILGTSCDVVDTVTGQSGKARYYCLNNDGYKSLLVAISEGYTSQPRAEGTVPPVKEDLVDGNNVIMLSGGREGVIGQHLLAGKVEDAMAVARHYANKHPGNFYIELQRIGHEDDNEYVQKAVELARSLSLPVVATNGVRFLEPEDHDHAHLRSAIDKGINVDEYLQLHSDEITQEQYYKTSEQMQELFSDIPSALENSVEIAKRCSIDIELGKYYLPAFPIPESYDFNGKRIETEAEYLRKMSLDGLEDRLVQLFGKDTAEYWQKKDEFHERLEFELNVITQMGFPGYFLIVADFIQWGKANDVPVGPGRGSGAGSLVAYALKITDLDPLEYDLLFERFLNPERVSMPDFDVDFCMNKRDQVIQYVADTYGHDAVSQIITYGTMSAKAVIRDVARARSYAYSVADRIAKQIPSEPGMTITKALEQNPALAAMCEKDPDVRYIISEARSLEGLARQTGKHAGGVLIADGKLTDFTATYADHNGEGLVSQLDKDDVEGVGLVKFDFLGLRTLTITDWALKFVNDSRAKKGEEPLRIEDISLKDKQSFELLKSAETTAVFQLESSGMKGIIRKLQPDCFEDLVALVALFRPGPLQSGMVDDFINRKHGRAEVSYPHPQYQHELLKPILEPTYGIILYQEQVMQIAQVLAGYTLGQADLLRRAMGKKKAEEMAKQRSEFIAGAEGNGIDGDLASNIFDLVEKFAGYGFNKSHSAAYALISYQTAWLKAHYPSEFMAAVASSDIDKTHKVVRFIDEIRRMGLRLAPPSVNRSEVLFTVDNGEIIYGLEACDGLGESVTKVLLAERETGGPFRDMFDLVNRVKVSKKQLATMIKAGMLDEFDTNRASLMASIDVALEAAKQGRKENDAQDDLFGGLSAAEELHTLVEAKPWSRQELLRNEKEALGLYFSGHPTDEYRESLEGEITDTLYNITEGNIQTKQGVTKTSDSSDYVGKNVSVIGSIADLELKATKKGNRAIFKIDDGTSMVKVNVDAKTYTECQYMLGENSLVMLEGVLKYHSEYGYSIAAEDIIEITTYRQKKTAEIRVEVPQGLDVHLAEARDIIQANEAGFTPVLLIEKGVNGERMPHPPLSTSYTPDLIHQLGCLFGEDNISALTKTQVEADPIKCNVDMSSLYKVDGALVDEDAWKRKVTQLLDEAEDLMGLGM